MIDIRIAPRADGRFDIHVESAGNHESLLNSSQGYEDASKAVDTVRQLFTDVSAQTLQKIRTVAADAIDRGVELNPSALIGLIDNAQRPESATLQVKFRDGGTWTEALR